MPLNSHPETSGLNQPPPPNHFLPLPNGSHVVYATTSLCGLSNAFRDLSRRRLFAFWKLFGVPLCSSQPTTASVSPIPLLSVYASEISDSLNRFVTLSCIE